MDKMTLREAARAIGASSPIEGEISCVVTDSREAAQGSLFIAIAGERLDGHDYVRRALESGAAAAVCSRPVEGCEGSCIMVENTLRAYGQLAAYNRSLCDIPVVGVTGSVGKTTMKDMCAAVLSAKYKTLATLANHNNEIGVPRTCLRLDSSCEAAVVEMGMNHFGEISRLSKISRPTMGVITKIGVSHIENLGSRDGILQAKLELLDGMGADAPLLLNGDDDKLVTVRERLGGRVKLFGIENPECCCRAANIAQEGESQSFDILYAGEKYRAKLPVLGLHNVYNACAAFLCGALNGVEPQSALKALASYIPDGNRQKIVRRNGMTFIEDCYNASPDSITAALAVLASLSCEGRRFAVLGDMLELGDYSEKAHRSCGAAAANSGVDFLYCFGELSKYYIEGAKSTGRNIKCSCFDSKEELARTLCSQLKEGDAALFKASHSMKFDEIFTRLYELIQ